MQQEPVAIGTEHERDIHHLSIGKRLLHTCTDDVGIVLCLDNGNRNIGFKEQEVVCPPWIAPAHGIAPDKHTPVGDIHFFPDLVMMVPAGTHECGSDEFGTDVPFTEFLLFQSIHSVILILCDNVLIPFHGYLHHKSRNVL